MPKPENVICEIVYGTHLYGTATPASDEDFKGVFLPSAREILLGRIPPSVYAGERDDSRKNLPGELDSEFYSLHRFVHLATQGQTVAIDMVFAPAALVSRTSEHGWVWDRIVAERHRLLSKQMNAFVGYARAQASKYGLRGDRLRQLRQFHEQVSALASREAGRPRLAEAWGELPRDDERTSPHGIRELQVAGKWFSETTEARLVAETVAKALAQYGERVKSAADHSSADWKALSHAVRVSRELLELLETGEVRFPLRDAPLLLSIKRGERSLAEVQELLDRDLASVEDGIRRSSLPESVDAKWWDDFVVETMQEHLADELRRAERQRTSPHP